MSLRPPAVSARKTPRNDLGLRGDRPDILAIIRAHVIATHNMTAWTQAALYLYFEGDSEAAGEALDQAEWWADEVAEIEAPFRLS